MTTITREQLIKRAQARLELMQEAAREFSESPNAQMDLRLAEIALASLDAGSDSKQVDELTMWVKRLAHSLKNARPNSKLHMDAMDYLCSKGLISAEDVLR